MGTRQCFNAPVGKVNINTYNTFNTKPMWSSILTTKPSLCYDIYIFFLQYTPHFELSQFKTVQLLEQLVSITSLLLSN